VICLLEEFSKGKMLTVKDDSKERQFNFIGELTVLVEYQVIAKYLQACRKVFDHNGELLLMTAAFFKRVMF
jgi:hypothetical protein